MTAPTTPAGATEQDWLDKVGLNVKLDYDGRKWHLSEDTKSDILAHEASAVLDGKIETWKAIRKSYPKSNARSTSVSRLTLADIDRELAALTKQKAAMQQEEK